MSKAALGAKFCLVLLMLLARPALGQGVMVLPLQGYCHPGRYMPVQVRAWAHSKDYRIQLNAPGAITTYIRFDGGRLDAVVPWMPVDARAAAVECLILPLNGEPSRTLPITLLRGNQRIIGYAAVDVEGALAAGRRLFPGDELIPIPLDATAPFPGNPAAWDTLDAAVLDEATAARAGESAFASMLAQGTAFAIRSNPGNGTLWPHWPWQAWGGGWRGLRLQAAGPQDALYNDGVYASVPIPRGGWPAEVRGQLAAHAGVFAILFLLLALWRPRWCGAWAVGLAIGCIGALAFYADSHRPIQTVGGKIRILHPGITQDDDWSFHTCHQRFVTFIRWTDTTRIVFGSSVSLDVSGVRIECYPNGDPDFIFFVISPQMKVALLSRRCGPKEPAVTPSLPIGSPLVHLARSLYMRPGDLLVGELPAAPLMAIAYNRVQPWPGVVMRRAAADSAR